MTIDGGKKHKVGDKGQRYEVRAKDREGKEFIIGWCGTLEGAERFAEGVKFHPSWHDPKIIDREDHKQKGEKK